MSAASTHCPYCNAQFSSPNAAPGARIICPRCGERFAVRPQASTAITANPDFPANEPHARPEAPVPPTPRLPVSNGLIALVLLSVMLLMASLGGIYAWRTAGIRRDYDSHMPRPSIIDIPLIARIALGVYVLVMVLAILRGWNRREKATGGKMDVGQYGIPALALFVLLGVGLALLAIQQRPVRPPMPGAPTGPDAVAAVLPSQLSSLGYVPDDVQLIVGIHVAEAWRTPMGRPFLDGSLPGGGGVGLDQIEAVTGLKFAEFDHAVLAVKLDKEKVLPRVFLIVKTIQPYNRAKIREVLKSAERVSEDRRTIEEIKITQWKTTASLWFADDNTLAVVWPSDDIKELPAKPKSGVENLPRELRSLLEQQLDPAAKKVPIQLWAAGDIDSWEELAARPVLAFFLKDSWPTLSSMNTVGLWAQLEEDANLKGVCRCANTQSAEALREFLQPEERGKGLATLLAKSNPLAIELTRSLIATREEEWVKAEAKISASTIHKSAAK
jgi:hypothetical protein